MISRFESLIQNEFVLQSEEIDKPVKKHSTLATTIMKAVCYTRSWIEEVNVKKGESYNARILIIKGPHEDP